MSKVLNTWKNAKRYEMFGYQIHVTKGTQARDRKFYTELHRDNAYLASMGSDMPTHFLAALETYIKRSKLL